MLLTLFTFIQADNDEKNDKKSRIKYIFYFVGIIIFMITPIRLLTQKYNEYNKIIQNKEYTLTKKGKILTINSKNEFLPPNDLEIIYDNNNEIQLKVDNQLFTIDKNSETINEK